MHMGALATTGRYANKVIDVSAISYRVNPALQKNRE